MDKQAEDASEKVRELENEKSDVISHIWVLSLMLEALSTIGDVRIYNRLMVERQYISIPRRIAKYKKRRISGAWLYTFYFIF
jgi:hypothetical protein